MDTIYALSTVQGKSAIAVVRISGPAAHDVLNRMCGDTLPEMRIASLRKIYDNDGAVLDHALVVRFDAKASFTGEDIAELHLHGGIAVVQGVLDALDKQDICRPASPGEFTRQALENGQVDLSQAEGLSDLIDAETEAQRKQSMELMSGALGQAVNMWREKLILAAALIEATIDFADEEVPTNVFPEVTELLDNVQRSLDSELAHVDVADRLRTGFEVAIMGPPNVGKSTLLNAIAGREAALTSDIPGTTRDVVEVRINLSGLPVTFLDTAGLRETDDHVESLGIAVAKKRSEQADIVIKLHENNMLEDIDQKKDVIHLLAKADLHIGKDGISGLTGQGVDRLLTDITDTLKEKTANIGVATNQRHRRAMSQATNAIEQALELEGNDGDSELIAENIRDALRHLDILVGRIDVENVLDEIFSRFCLGK